jgi:hypothetical protein
MRTGSPVNATFKGKHREEYAWFSIADSLPILSMDSDKAAAKILRACRDGRGEVFIESPLNLANVLQRQFPELTQEILGLSNRMLPEMGGIGRSSARGGQSESAWTRSPLTRLSRRAAIKNNER